MLDNLCTSGEHWCRRSLLRGVPIFEKPLNIKSFYSNVTTFVIVRTNTERVATLVDWLMRLFFHVIKAPREESPTRQSSAVFVTLLC
jgi:hypothetical protein